MCKPVIKVTETNSCQVSSSLACDTSPLRFKFNSYLQGGFYPGGCSRVLASPTLSSETDAALVTPTRRVTSVPPDACSCFSYRVHFP